MRRIISVRRGNGVGRVYRLVVFLLAMFCASAPVRAEGYEDSTREMIQQLIRANDLLIAGHAAESRTLVQQMGESIRKLDGLASNYRDIANREHTRCTERIADLDVRTNKLYGEEMALQKQIDDLSASLKGAAEKSRLADANIKQLNARISATIRRMQERQAKLQEMQKWWWVPGYGQYLAIRTLVDNDIGEYNGAISALQDAQRRLASNSTTLSQARSLIGTLNSNKQRVEKMKSSLKEMRDSAQASLQGLNGSAVFLTDADVFWGLMQNLLQVDGDSYVRKMKILQAVLAREVKSPSFAQPTVMMAQNFQQKLVDFADSIDKQSNFLLQPTTHFCGGPAAINANVNVSSRCNIDAITSYYEIVDPKTCSFRYLAPPGCPPAAKSVDTDSNALSRGRARGAWNRADGQNWIGRPGSSPCTTEGTIYYGKLSGSAQCEAMCMGDPDCTIWTFNVSNGFMPNSINQCWGGPATLEANKRAWGGFLSGGIR